MKISYMGMKNKIKRKLEKIYSELNEIKKSSLVEKNPKLTYQCEESMTSIDNLLYSLDNMEDIITEYTVDCDIQWDAPENEDLPQTLEGYKVYVRSDETLSEMIVEQLTDEYGFCVNGVGYDIIKQREV